MVLLDGKKVSEELKIEVKARVEAMVALGNPRPHLAAVLVGEDPASQTYVSNKIKSCFETGIESSMHRYDATLTEEALLNLVRQLNEDEKVTGILVQLPLPSHINAQKVIETINVEKDVDGFHPENIGRMAKELSCFIPATPFGILKLLEYYKIETAGKHCVVVGRSHIVGSPISILMARNNYPGNCTVTLCHSKTKDLKEHCLRADIIIAAIGKPDYIKADMVKEGAIVVDVGINRVADATKKSGHKLVGDVDFENVAPKCSFITPVPGGVGAMTIASLLLNTIQAADANSAVPLFPMHTEK